MSPLPLQWKWAIKLFHPGRELKALFTELQSFFQQGPHSPLRGELQELRLMIGSPVTQLFLRTRQKECMMISNVMFEQDSEKCLSLKSVQNLDAVLIARSQFLTKSLPYLNSLNFWNGKINI